jgi:DnaK suppressor protein
MSAPRQRAAKSIPAAAAPARGPAWRALLEAQWRARLQEVTELSLAYHEAAAATAPDRAPRQLLRRAVAARRALADTDEALGRLASGRYGLCEGCTAAIPARLLAAAPDTRYCPRCRPVPDTRAKPAMAAQAGHAMAGAVPVTHASRRRPVPSPPPGQVNGRDHE